MDIMQKLYFRPLQLIQAYQHTPWRSQLRLIGMFTAVLVGLAVVGSIYVSVTAQAGEEGRKIQFLKETAVGYTRENANLESEYALLTSAEVLEQRARELGFIPVSPGQLVYLPVPGLNLPPVGQVAPPSQFIESPDTTLPPEFSQTLFDWVYEFSFGSSINGRRP